jgi:hypothetical protein
VAGVDWERVVTRLKATIVEKRSWGTRELTQVLTELEVECSTDGRYDPLPQRQGNSGRPATERRRHRRHAGGDGDGPETPLTEEDGHGEQHAATTGGRVTAQSR